MTLLYSAAECPFTEDELTWARLCSLPGTVHREVAGRRTVRVETPAGGCFLKLHDGVGWREIIKNLAFGRLPVTGARNEWRAFVRLERSGVRTPEPLAFGESGSNPARRRSWLLMTEVAAAESLEDVCGRWPGQPPGASFKYNLLRDVATIVRNLHGAGVNHRDLYICHFLRQTDGNLTLIDLHRAQVRPAVPERWLVKDLGGLLFSALDIGLSRRDVLRFAREYWGTDWRTSLADRRLMASILDRAQRLYGRRSGLLDALRSRL